MAQKLLGAAGRPAHEPTQALRNMVELATAAGVTQEVISRMLDIDVKTLRKHYGTELIVGRDRPTVHVVGILYAMIQDPTIEPNVKLGCISRWLTTIAGMDGKLKSTQEEKRAVKGLIWKEAPKT